MLGLSGFLNHWRERSFAGSFLVFLAMLCFSSATPWPRGLRLSGSWGNGGILPEGKDECRDLRTVRTRNRSSSSGLPCHEKYAQSQGQAQWGIQRGIEPGESAAADCLEETHQA